MQSIGSAQELEKTGVHFDLILLEQSVHSVQDVQKACSCESAEVIKSLVFIGKNPLMILLPGNKPRQLTLFSSKTGEIGCATKIKTVGSGCT